jgi:hypothetical protein
MTDWSHRRLLPASTLLLLLSLALPVAAAAQSEADWNSARALELIGRARARRQLPQADTSLHNYRARAEGFVYFYLDRAESAERTLVKTDQVALEMFWAQPDQTKQRIVGLRDQSRLPNRMYYHLDHLTVVQNGFGDLIRIGDGDEVRDVPHPAGRDSESVYDFRIADSLELRLPGTAAPIKVYELNVRPRRADRSGLVGSVFVDRGTADIVRMTFTFTPASYVDRRLDYIQISLDNGLWEGRYWLPNEQRLEIRRQLPELDFVAGAVILGRMRITDYVFNDTLPPTLFAGYPVEAVPHVQRENYPFERDIYADLDEAGLQPAPELAELRAQAAELLRGKRLSGLPRLRLQLASASSALRYNRAEGLFLGTGATYSPSFAWRVDGRAGYAFGPERPGASLRLRHAGPHGEVSLAGYLNEHRDLGISLPVAPALNTVSSALLGEDYLDPFRTSGARLSWQPASLGAWRLEVGASTERQRRATLEQRHPPLDDSTAFRPVRAIDAGDQFALDARLERPLSDARQLAWGASLAVLGGALERQGFLRGTADVTLRLRNLSQSRSLQARAMAGAVSGTEPASQHLFLLGGAGTLPGHAYRGFAGSRFALLQVELSQDVLRPWLRARLVGAAGATGGLGDHGNRAWRAWDVRGTDGVKFSAGAGISLFWDILRIDRVHGLGGGGWVFQLSASPDFANIS